MNMIVRTLICAAAASLLFLAGGEMSLAASGGGPINTEIRDDDGALIAVMNVEMTRRAAAMGYPVRRLGARPLTSLPLFQWPLQNTATSMGFAEEFISQHVDHDASAGVQDFTCGNRTYDGHTGTDIALASYPWVEMDRKESRVVAALPGVIVDKHDGEFDRQCTMSSAPANYVVIRHSNGLLGYYYHLKSGTVPTKAIGASVGLGEAIGFVGSSGNSTGPHLHFEVRDAGGALLDPFGGSCNVGGAEWAHQARPFDPRVVRVATHSAAPPSAGNCANPDPLYATTFLPNADVFGAIYLRDQLANLKATGEFVRPDGTVASSFQTGAPTTGFYANAYWYSSYHLPPDASTGAWRFRAKLNGRAFEQGFWVGSTGKPGGTTIALTIESPTRTITAGQSAKFKQFRRQLGGRLPPDHDTPTQGRYGVPAGQSDHRS